MPIQVEDEFLNQIFEAIEENAAVIAKVDLKNQVFEIPSKNLNTEFEINAYKKECLLHSYDDLDYLLAKTEAIEAFEKKRSLVLV